MLCTILFFTIQFNSLFEKHYISYFLLFTNYYKLYINYKLLELISKHTLYMRYLCVCVYIQYTQYVYVYI